RRSSDLDVFPFVDHLSEGIDTEQFIRSHFTQPDLFIRIKRGDEDFVETNLDKKEVNYKAISPNTLALSNGFRMQDFPYLKGKYEVQDLSSQHTINFMDANTGESRSEEHTSELQSRENLVCRLLLEKEQQRAQR